MDSQSSAKIIVEIMRVASFPGLFELFNPTTGRQRRKSE